MSSDKIILNVGGLRFTTVKSTLANVPETRLSRLDESHPSFDPVLKEYFFDRNPEHFNSILDFYRTGQLHFSHCRCGPGIKGELRYWGLDENCISSCCWKAYTAFEDMKTTLDHLDKTLNKDSPLPRKPSSSSLRRDSDPKDVSWFSHVRYRIWSFLDDPQSSKGAQVWSVLFYALILLSAGSAALFSHPGCRVGDDVYAQFNDSNPKVEMLWKTVPHPALDYLDKTLVCIFTLELVLRIASCPSKFRFIKSIYNIIDLVCVVPLFAVFVLEVAWFKLWHKGQVAIIFAFLSFTSVLRVVRLFKIARHHRSLRILHLAMRSSLRELMLLFVLIFQGMLVFSTLVYFAEFSQADSFAHIPIGMWWSLITMTTVGYGDYAPQSFWGYMVGGTCAISGILITGFTIPIIASNFNHYHKYAKLASKLSERKRQNVWPKWTGRMTAAGSGSVVGTTPSVLVPAKWHSNNRPYHHHDCPNNNRLTPSNSERKAHHGQGQTPPLSTVMASPRASASPRATAMSLTVTSPGMTSLGVPQTSPRRIERRQSNSNRIMPTVSEDERTDINTSYA